MLRSGVRSRRVVLPILLGILLVATAPVDAAWRAAGSLEPDTPDDVTGNRMWLDPDAAHAPSDRIYFNAFQSVPQTAANPNLATTGSRILPAPVTHHRALLGIWTDCNDDGHVGSAETALMEYSSALLLDPTRCPVGSAHNDGRWVSEMLTIGAVDPCEFEPDAVREAECPGVNGFHVNEHVAYANDTYVWGDTGAPGSIPPRECVLAPLPRGTTGSTGGLLAWADCQIGHAVARTVNDVDDDGALGLRFDDPERPHDSSSHLNQPLPVTPFGGPRGAGLVEKDSGRPAFRAWDCQEPRGTADVRDPTAPEGRRGALSEVVLHDPSGGHLTGPRFPLVILGVYFEDHDNDPSTPGQLRVPLTDERGSYARVPTVAFSLDDDPPAASWWDALTRTNDGITGDCDPATSDAVTNAHPGAAIEGDRAPILEARKDRPSVTMTFFDGHRGIHPSLDSTTGDTTPSDGGISARRHGRLGAGPEWSATTTTEQDPQLVQRGDFGAAHAAWFTYYAHMGAEAFASGATTAAGGNAFTYGAENCGNDQAGVRNGWVCDRDAWWKGANGEDVRPRYARGEPIGRLVGDAYHLRDVDCYDGSLARGTPPVLGLVALSETGPCPGPR